MLNCQWYMYIDVDGISSTKSCILIAISPVAYSSCIQNILYTISPPSLKIRTMQYLLSWFWCGIQAEVHIFSYQSNWLFRLLHVGGFLFYCCEEIWLNFGILWSVRCKWYSLDLHSVPIGCFCWKPAKGKLI